MSRKRKKSLIDWSFGDPVFDDFDRMLDGFGKGRDSQGGYSISVSQTPEGTKVQATVGKVADVNALRRQLQQQYLGAQIEIEGGQSLIREISTRPIEEEDGEDQEEP